MSKKEEIKIVVVESSKIYEKKISNRIEDIYGLVFYPYKEIQISESIYIIYSMEATEKRDEIFRKNIIINEVNIHGTFVIVKKQRDQFVTLSKDEIRYFKDIFKKEEK